MIKMANKTCPECGKEQDESFKFCKNCGTLLVDENKNNNSDDVKICPECGASQGKSSKFCINCGTSLSEEKENIDSHNLNQYDSSENIEIEDKAYNDFNGFKVCPECGTKEKGLSKFCKNCGTLLDEKNDGGGNVIIKCGNCGAELNDEIYCPDCGKQTGITFCPKCRQRTVNEDFCTNCGYKINKFVKNCNKCGSKIDLMAEVCPKCGAKVINKNPLVAATLSFFFPGWGQLYNNQNSKGISLIIASIISFILAFILIGIILFILIEIYGIHDAFVSAKAINNGEFVEDRIF